MARIFFSFFSMLLLATAICGQPNRLYLPPELPSLADSPYRLDVPIQFMKHPLFTSQFRAEFINDVQASLAQHLGELGTVHTYDLDVTPSHQQSELCQAFASDGFEALERPKFRELTGISTHVVMVSINQGQVECATRRHDGDTGLTTSSIRRATTTDLSTASRLAGIIIAKDFSPTATAKPSEKDNNTLIIEPRATKLPGLERIIQRDDIFVVSEVFIQNTTENTDRATLATRPREYTLLKIEAKLQHGQYRCRVFTGYKTPFSNTRSLIGVRAMLVPTTKRIVALEILDQNGKKPKPALPIKVYASEIDFPRLEDHSKRMEYVNQQYRSASLVNRLACITIALGTEEARRFPIPIYDHTDSKPIIFKFPLEQNAIARAEFESRLEDWLSRVRSLTETQQSLTKEVSRLIVAGKNQQALERGATGIETIEALEQTIQAELVTLKQQPISQDEIYKLRLQQGEQRIAKLKEVRPALAQKVDELRALVGKSVDPSKFEREFAAKELNQRIKTLLDRGEIEEALDMFDLLYDLVKTELIKEQKAKVESEWKTKNKEHDNARIFISNVWRRINSVEEYQNNLENLKQSLQVIQNVNDRLGLRNFITTIEQSYNVLKDILDRLDLESESDKEYLEKIQFVSKELSELENIAKSTLARIEGENKN